MGWVAEDTPTNMAWAIWYTFMEAPYTDRAISLPYTLAAPQVFIRLFMVTCTRAVMIWVRKLGKPSLRILLVSAAVGFR